MDEQIMHLDWRTLPKVSKIQLEIAGALLDVDKDGYWMKETVNTRAKDVIHLESIQVGRDVHHYVARTRHLTKKPFDRFELYFAKLYKLVEFLLKQTSNHTHVKKRFSECAVSLVMRQSQLWTMVMDLALTRGLHPSSLGIEVEANGLLWSGKDVRTKLRLADNLFDLAEYKPKLQIAHPEYTEAALADFIEEQCSSMKLKGRPCTVPAPIWNLEAMCIRAVVVTEHANLGKSMPVITKNWANVHVVMTQGYGGWAIREYLSLVSRRALTHIPFLYFSDHDMQGFQIFLTLKYGARTTAFAGPDMTCPRLKWAGPTIKQLVAHHKAHFKGPPDSWKVQKKAVLDKIDVKVTRTDRSIYKCFQEMGYLDHEPELHEEIKLIMNEDHEGVRGVRSA